MADMRGINPIGRDIQGLTGARAYGQGASQYKMAGDLSKQQGQTQRQGKDLALREQQAAFTKSLQEQQEDIKLAQQYAKEDVQRLAEGYQERWSYLLRDLSEARNVAAEQLSQGLTDEAKQSAIAGMFSGAGNIINSAMKYSQGDMGFSGQVKDERQTRESEMFAQKLYNDQKFNEDLNSRFNQDKVPYYNGQPVQLGVDTGWNPDEPMPERYPNWKSEYANSRERLLEKPLNTGNYSPSELTTNEYLSEYGKPSNELSPINTYSYNYNNPENYPSKGYEETPEQTQKINTKLRSIFRIPGGQ